MAPRCDLVDRPDHRCVGRVRARSVVVEPASPDEPGIHKMRCDAGWPMFSKDSSDDPARWSNDRRSRERRSELVPDVVVVSADAMSRPPSRR